MTTLAETFAEMAIDALHEWFPRYPAADSDEAAFYGTRVVVTEHEGDTITFLATQQTWPYEARRFTVRVQVTEEVLSNVVTRPTFR